MQTPKYKATRQAQLGYYVPGQEPPIIYDGELYYVCWQVAGDFKVFDKLDDRLVETFNVAGVDLDTATVLARDYVEELNNE